ncbi:DEAD/DEAH box helicase [Halalkalicoccus salilacus]|uniref:DEAD/DEAH box helicase n=1 Tax=Halalkalicoccus TaxID=332246 RepID=UPI002F969F65
MDEIFSHWRYEDATLLKTDVRGVEYDPVNVVEAAEQAKEALNIKVPDGNKYVIPLFAPDEPVPTDKYVFYRPEYDQIGWFDSGFGISGIERFVSCTELETTEIGYRLRFWLPAYRDDIELPVDESKLPPEQMQPSNQLDTDEQEAFFEDLRRFVYSERENERESNWERYTEMGFNEAIRRNRVSSPFLYIRETTAKNGDTGYIFQKVEEDDDQDGDIDLRDDEGIFNENFYIADTEDDDEQFPLEVEVLSVNGPTITIRPNWNSVADRTVAEQVLISNETEVRFHDLLNPIPYERRLTAIKEVKENREKRELLTGKRPITFSINKYALPEPPMDLNDYQRLALIWADGTRDAVCIHGPPGTGKTRTLTAYVQHAVAKGQSVLVTAHSNQAVDNLLVGDSTLQTPEEDTLHALAEDADTDLSIARIGNNSRNQVVQENYVTRSVGSANVVAATTSGASQFDQNKFDVAVIDEATQASRPATAIVLNSARKIVLAGDHKQLPPYCSDELMQEEDMHISLFEYFLDRYDGISVLLRRQYRMNEEIAAFPNEAFYDGHLETADQCRDWTIDNLDPITGIDIDGKEQRETYSNSFYNSQETQAVARQVQLLVQRGLQPTDIGVISAYSGQVKTIRNIVNDLDIENSSQIDINTVDSFQGGEREAIIVSFVRSNSKSHSGFLEFPEEGARRLNVALTRARKRLVLIGNWTTLGTVAPHRSPEESCAHHYADLEDHLKTSDKMLTNRT